MSLAKAIYAYLSAAPGVAALVGNRIYPGIAPEAATYPLLQWQEITSVRLPVLSGRHEIKVPTVQIDSYAQQGVGLSGHTAVAKAVATAVENAMEDFHGVYAGVEVKGAVLESERELYELDGRLARMSQDYRIWWKETN